MISSNDSKNYRRISGQSGDRAPLTTGTKRPRALYTAAGGELSLDLQTLAPQISYQPGQAQLDIKSSIGSYILNTDYYETSSTTIAFVQPLVAGEILEITQSFQVTGSVVAEDVPQVYTLNNALAGTTTITADFSWPLNSNPSKRVGSVEVYINGTMQQRSANNIASGDADYHEVDNGLANTNQITLTQSLIGGENVVLKPSYRPVDVNAASTSWSESSISQVQSNFSEGFQDFFQSSNTIFVPYTTIINRAKIPDLANDLKPRMGIERIITQNIYQIQNEFGPNGEPVFGVVNDTFGQIRLVGYDWVDQKDVSGTRARSATNENYIEISFVGTGLNFLAYNNSVVNVRVSVDGGLYGPNIISPSGGVLESRNYTPNIIFNAASGLSLGLHTIIVKNYSSTGTGFNCAGFEILNESTNIKTNPGISFNQGKKLELLTQDSTSYSTGVTGTRGGRMLVYQNASGINRSFQATNAAAAYLTSADHTNEEIVRTYHWREFGAGRADDFSLLTSAFSTRTFTLDDGTTTLVGTNIGSSSYQLGEEVRISAGTTNFITLTFIGTGLDVEFHNDTNVSRQLSVSIDGAASSGNLTGTSNEKSIRRIVSGLPYGTHTVKFTNTQAGLDSPGIRSFIIYQPKTPSLPSGAVELGAYNVMADYSGVGVGSTTDNDQVPVGVLKKYSSREFVYVGTWTATAVTTNPGGLNLVTATQNDYTQYTFVGTGFVIHQAASGGGTITETIHVDGSLNASGVSRSGANVSNSGGGTYTVNSTTGGAPVRIEFTGLTFGLHTIKVTRTSTTGANNLNIVGVDVITPIHSHKSNISADYQNTLTVGSNGISDNRKFTPIKETVSTKKNWVQAVGITASPTTTATSPVPVPEMSVTIKTNDGVITITATLPASVNSAGSAFIGAIYVDGVAVGKQIKAHSSASGEVVPLSFYLKVPVSSGYHKVDLYWYCGGPVTATADGTARILTVEED